MKDDTSEIINNATCYTINGENSLYAYRNNIRYSYIRIGSEWKNTSTQQYNNLPVSSVCFSYSDISSLNSHSEFEPIFVFIALIMVVFVWLLWFNVFKRITRWKP